MVENGMPMLRICQSALLVTTLLPIAACTFYSARVSSNSQEAAAPKTAVPDQWLGKWIGPEGTFLVLSKSADKYIIQIQSLDGPNTYDGKANGDSIEFIREGTVRIYSRRFRPGHRHEVAPR